MSKPPLRFKVLVEAFRVASLVIVIGWAGVIALAYIITIPAREPLPRVHSALLTILAIILFVAWLASWRALARNLILGGSKTSGS